MLTVGHLRTGALAAPTVLGDRHPLLSFEAVAGEPADVLVGFELQSGRGAFDPARVVPDLWQTEVAASARSVRYAGAPLGSRDELWWRVRPVSASGPGRWSPAARAELGLLGVSDWSASWITHPQWAQPEPPDACPVLTTTVTVDAPVQRARLYVSGLGVYVVEVDGVAVDDAVLEPGSSDVSVRVAARALDVAAHLAPGTHTLTVRLGEGGTHVREAPGRYTKFVGRHHVPATLVQLEVLDVNGQWARTVSDAGWRATLGATRLAHWYGGEDYDARVDLASPATRWEPAHVVQAAQQGPRPWWRAAPPVRVQRTIDPVARTAVAVGPDSAVVVLDFGVNLAGRAVLGLDAGVPAGSVLTMRPAERLGDDGRIDQSTCGTPVFDTYVAAAGGGSWRPDFGYHGFRHVQVEGPADVLTRSGALTLRAEVLRTDDVPAGTFRTDDSRLLRLDALVRQAIESNLFSMPTDCPHREKLGWLEQLHLVFGPVAHAFDVQAHFRDVVTHVLDAQTADGLVPSIAPELTEFDGGFRFDVNWGAAVLEVPWRLYETYGDVEPLAAAWAGGLRYLDLLECHADGGLLGNGLGDWKSLGEPTPLALVAGHGHVRLLETAARTARVLGHDPAPFEVDAARRRALLTAAFVDPLTGVCGSGSQGSYALALELGLVAEEARDRALALLLQRIEDDHHHMAVGEIALPALLRVLAAAGRHDVVHELVTQTSGPGYGRMLHDGSTALAEAWHDPDHQDSANHFMLGVVGDWLVGDVAGLRQAPGSVGWQHVLVRPGVVEAVRSAGATYRSGYGTTSVDWERTGTGLSVRVEVPLGCTATIEVPRRPGQQVSHDPSLRSVDDVAGVVRLLAPAGTWAVESG